MHISVVELYRYATVGLQVGYCTLSFKELLIKLSLNLLLLFKQPLFWTPGLDLRILVRFALTSNS